MTEQKSIFISLKLPEQLAQAARVEAAKLDISRSEFIRRLLNDAIEKLQEEKQPIKEL